jgi:hypothetical protein
MRLSGGKNLSLLQIASTKLYCYHSVIINVIEYKQKSVINCFTKIWQYVVSLIYCIDNKNTTMVLYQILYYVGKQVQCLHQIINF